MEGSEPDQLSGEVFLSYARVDGEYVDRLERVLRRHDVGVWRDSMIPHGADWAESIEERLETSSAFVIVVSEATRASQWVKSELTRAQRRGLPIFPVLLSGEILLALESTKYFDVRDGRELPPKFFQDLRGVLGSTPQPHVEATTPNTIPEADFGWKSLLADPHLTLRSWAAIELAGDPRLELERQIELAMAELPPCSTFKAPRSRLNIDHSPSWGWVYVSVSRVRKRTERYVARLGMHTGPTEDASLRRQLRDRLGKAGWSTSNDIVERRITEAAGAQFTYGAWPRSSHAIQSDAEMFSSRGAPASDVAEATVELLIDLLEASPDLVRLSIARDG